MLAAMLALNACGGNGGGDMSPPRAARALPAGWRVCPVGCRRWLHDARVWSPGAAGVSGINFANAEVEPCPAIHPGNPNLLLVTRLQSRRSNGGARALVGAVSGDGGVTRTRTLHPMSRCDGAGMPV